MPERPRPKPAPPRRRPEPAPPEFATCPNCPDQGIVLHLGYGVCPSCDTTWERDETGTMLAR